MGRTDLRDRARHLGAVRTDHQELSRQRAGGRHDRGGRGEPAPRRRRSRGGCPGRHAARGRDLDALGGRRLVLGGRAPLRAGPHPCGDLRPATWRIVVLDRRRQGPRRRRRRPRDRGPAASAHAGREPPRPRDRGALLRERAAIPPPLSGPPRARRGRPRGFPRADPGAARAPPTNAPAPRGVDAPRGCGGDRLRDRSQAAVDAVPRRFVPPAVAGRGPALRRRGSGLADRSEPGAGSPPSSSRRRWPSSPSARPPKWRRI